MVERRYPPIGDYALLADCHSAALVSSTGSIDWACLRRFDSSSVFGRILDWERGGTFAINPHGVTEWHRRYVGDSLVLETTAVTKTGTMTITDAFAMVEGGERTPLHQLLRIVECRQGTVTFDVVVAPRFDYGELRPWLRRAPLEDDLPQESAMGDEADGLTRRGVYSAVGGHVALTISAELDLDVDQERIALIGGCQLSAGERCRFSVVADEPHDLDVHAAGPKLVQQRMNDTIEWWRRWSSRAVAGGPYEHLVRRSAVVLKGLTCAPTGAIVAAPTTSLPEEIGGVRNWDYRYSWIRDSTLALAALCLTGHPEVAQGFRDFLLRSAAGSPSDLQIMYGIYGERHLPEYELPDLEGYRGSRPVRVGNGASRQRQLDVYGHVMDAAHLWRQEMTEIAPEEWRFLRAVVNQAAAVWEQPDHGIWEIRGTPRHFVQSKVMLWVALDRGIDTVEQLNLDEPDEDRWRDVRERIREAVMTRGIDERRGCFVQSFGSTELDAALLSLPMVGFIDVSDPLMKATIDAIQTDLAVDPHGFLLRYRPARYDDGLPGDEATFLMCSFWLVDVLAMQGRVDEARAMFERLISAGNDLALFGEEYEPSTGQQLGNFPQAFTHMALINSAHQLALARQRGDGRPATWNECRSISAWTSSRHPRTRED